ncbi:Protein CBG07235 [Caenorhabditis briggsae]|uniref:WD repeat and HMG-box DNA-binding protein 1 n=1 Tax=Caenorhabditis briggsae TaxID=6238 RepID=A8X555_CAEBR|nr:Protein CBG07235 [Caenorhabditis briggsae]CAP27766.2 Protein CBG07235 [Caenorhabditis briggsae]
MSGPLHYYPTSSDQENGEQGIETANAPASVPLTAFSLWADTMRGTVRGEHPDLEMDDVELKLTAMWRDLTANEKNVFEENLKKMRKYDMPWCAYFLFCKEKRREFTDKHGNLPGGEVTKILGATWKNLSAAEKAPYLEKSAEKKKIYRAKWGATQKEEREAVKRQNAAKRQATAAAAAGNPRPAKRTRINHSARDVPPLSPRSLSQSPLLGSTSSDYYRSSTSPSESEPNAWNELESIQPTFIVTGDFPWQQICQEFGLENNTFK